MRHDTWITARLQTHGRRIIHIVDLAVDLLVATGVVLMAVSLLMQVVWRYGLGHSLSWSEEFARYMLVWTAMLGAASLARLGNLSAVDLLTSRDSDVGRTCFFISRLATSIFAALLTWSGLRYVVGNVAQQSAALGVSKAWVYGALPSGAILLGVWAWRAPPPVSSPFVQDMARGEASAASQATSPPRSSHELSRTAPPWP